MITVSTFLGFKSYKSFSKLLPLNEIFYYINVNCKGWLAVSADFCKAVGSCRGSSLVFQLPQFTSLTYSIKDHRSQIAIGKSPRIRGV